MILESQSATQPKENTMIEIKDKYSSAYDDGNIPDIDCPPADDSLQIEAMSKKGKARRGESPTTTPS